MEENYKAEDTPLTRLVGRYVNNLIYYETFEKAVKELYSDKKDSKLTLKEFDLEAAKAGKPVCTRDGRKARIICFDAKDDKERYIIALVDSRDCKKELAYTYDNSGKCCFNYSSTSNDDLMMLPEKREGWTNVYKDGQNRFTRGFFQTIEMAKNATNPPGATRIATVRIEWEE